MTLDRPMTAAPFVVQHRNEVRIMGLTGADPQSRGIVDQFRRAIDHGAGLLAQSGLSLHDVVRITCLVQDCDAFTGCFGLLREALGPASPIFTLRTVTSFDRDDVALEMELTAIHR